MMTETLGSVGYDLLNLTDRSHEGQAHDRQIVVATRCKQPFFGNAISTQRPQKSKPLIVYLT
jgi:hypothetical protein